MKQVLQKVGLLIAMLLATLQGSAYDFEVDGIYYNIVSLSDLTCEVTYNEANKNSQYLSFLYDRGQTYDYSNLKISYPSYSGNLTVPETVNYKGRTLKVTGIGEYAFLNCSELKSLTLPASIADIKEITVYPNGDCYAGAFDYCGIENLTVGNSYTLQMFDQSYAFQNGCKTKDHLKELVLSDNFSGNIGVDFSTYSKLVSIRSNTVTPPIFSEGTHFTNDQYLNTSVFVPENALANYQVADVWKDFWDLTAMKAVKSISLNESSLSLEPAKTFQLTVTVSPEDAFDATIEWKSSNPEVAIVDENGLVKAITKGDAIITVSAKDGSCVTAQCTVHVDLLVKEINLSDSEIGLEPGDSKKLKVTISPAEAFVKDVDWNSDNDAVAAVDQDGNVTAKTIGTANITVSTKDGSNLTASCKVTVAELVKAIVVAPANITIKEDETTQLSCTVSPETATHKNVVWSSEDSDIATVDESGFVKGVSSGTTIIKATATDGSNVFGQCEVTVTAQTLEENGICFQRNSPSSLKIVANSNKPYNGDFFIPSTATFDGKEMSVTEIGSDAFSNCDELTRIVIPASIRKINQNAFAGCSKLVYVKVCNGSEITCNIDELFSDSSIEELYVGSDGISYNSDSRILKSLKGMTLGNVVSTFPPAEVFNSLQYFIVEDGENSIVEPEDYCTTSMSLINQQEVRDTYTKIYYRFFYLVKIQHLSPILRSAENSTLNYFHIGREVQDYEVDQSKTQEIIPTTAGSRYQEYGYNDEVNYQYEEFGVKTDYNRNPIESISFDKSQIELANGSSIKLTVAFNPTNASFTVLNWSSSDEDVAVVDVFGNVTKLKDGEAIITASTTDGSDLTTTCKVVNPVAGIVCVAVDKSAAFDVYNIEGIMILRNCNDSQLKSLAPGIYILRQGVKNEKVYIR